MKTRNNLKQKALLREVVFVLTHPLVFGKLLIFALKEQLYQTLTIMKNFYPIIVCFALALGATSIVSAQQPDFLFEHPYPYEFTHVVFLEEQVEVVHLEIAPDGDSEGCYFVAASDSKNASSYESDSVAFMPMVYKVSLGGEILGELALGYEDRYFMVNRLFEDPQDVRCCLAVGFTHDNVLHYDRPFMAKFDHDMNLLWQKEIELPEPYQGNILLASIMDSGNDIVCCLGVTGLSSVVFCRLTTEGELAAINHPPGQYDSFVVNCGSFFEFRDGSGDYGKLVESSSGYSTQTYLVRINRDLELVSSTLVPTTIDDHTQSNYHQVVLSCISPFIYTIDPLPDGSMVLGFPGLMTRIDHQYNLQRDKVVAMVRFDPEGDLISYSATGQGDTGVENDSIKAIQGSTCMDLVGDDSFYFYHTVGAPHGTGYDWMNCFVVTKMDIDGNVIWQRYWDRYHPEHGMKVYYPNFITTTSDEGCLVSGYSYYSDIYGSVRYGSNPEIFMLKFFSDGTLSVPDMEAFVRPYAYWPNPAQDELHLQYSPDVTPTQIELHDLQGRMVRSQRNGLESLNLQGLSSGTYTMRVTLAGGKVFTDKVVKE